jgi:hypothetical protein
MNEPTNKYRSCLIYETLNLRFVLSVEHRMTPSKGIFKLSQIDFSVFFVAVAESHKVQ